MMRLNPKKLSSVLLFLLLLLLVACGTQEPNKEEVKDDISVIASGNAELSILVEALTKADLVTALQAEGPFTVFAPSNAAFSALLDTLKITKEELLARTDLADILKYHVISGNAFSSDSLKSAPGQKITLQGESVNYALIDGNLVLNESSSVTTADVNASNGVIHLIDAVLLPPSIATPPALDSIIKLAEKTADLSVLVEAIEAANLATVLDGTGPLTVFAPNNAAFSAILEDLKISKETFLARSDLADILKYHLIDAQKLSAADLIAQSPGDISSLQGEKINHTVDGTTLVLNGNSKVSAPDIQASNGVIHIIDAVILPPSIANPPLKTITELAADIPELSTLVAALKAAGLDTALNAEGPFTIFAPSNDAFTALIEATEGVTNLEELIAKLGAEAISDLLKYHVVSGSKLSAADLISAAPEITKSLQGDAIFYEVIEGKVTLNGKTKVTSPDAEASNGVIHVLDSVLAIPESKTYSLDAVSESGVSGSITFTRKVDDTSLVSIELTGTTAGFKHPAHVHIGDSADGGAIYAFLPFVDGTTGKALGTVTKTNLGSDLSYDTLIAFDGYVNIHTGKAGATPGDQGDLTVVATGEVGLPNTLSYALSEVADSGVSGSITFSKKEDKTTLVTIDLTGAVAGNTHPAHIHVGSATTPGAIYLFLPFVDGTTGKAEGTVIETNAATPITYTEIAAYDGYVNIHLGKAGATPADQGDLTVVATGEVGAGATPISLPE